MDLTEALKMLSGQSPSVVICMAFLWFLYNESKNQRAERMADREHRAKMVNECHSQHSMLLNGFLPVMQEMKSAMEDNSRHMEACRDANERNTRQAEKAEISHEMFMRFIERHIGGALQ